MSPTCLRQTAECVYLAVKLQPRASRTEIQGLHGNELRISVTAPPVDSAGNDALVEFLAERLGLSRGSVQLSRGQTSRHKTVFIAGVRSSDVAQRLGF